MPVDGAGGGFKGFGPDALAWLREIREHNDRAWFAEHKARYEREVRDPMRSLVEELGGLFGPGKVYRPNRDVRFSRDKRPYKEWVAALIGEDGNATGRYLQLDADHLMVGAGTYAFDPPTLKRYRAAVVAEASGRPLAELISELRAAGYDVGQATLKRGPRDVDPDHPRLELLKHTSLTMRRSHEAGAWLEEPSVVLRTVIESFMAAEPLLAWMRQRIA